MNIVELPPVVGRRDAEFRAWFEWSNDVYAAFDGFVSRRLLKDTAAPGRYAAIVEHASEATFMAMHTSGARQEAWERVERLLTGSPAPRLYVIVTSADRATPAL